MIYNTICIKFKKPICFIDRGYFFFEVLQYCDETIHLSSKNKKSRTILLENRELWVDFGRNLVKFVWSKM